MEKIVRLLLILIVFKSFEAFSIEKGKWTFIKEENWCYIGSIPIKEEGDYTQRGDTYVIVYKINKSPEMILQVNAGYNYNEKELIQLTVDKKDYELFSQGDTAWSANEDKEIIYAMIKGNQMIIKGISSRGTLTTDTYTLTGFTAAHNKLKKDC